MTNPAPYATHIARMAEATTRYPFKFWGFGESVAMEALLAAGGAPGHWATNHIITWARDHAPLAENPLAHVAPGVPVLMVAEAKAEDREPLLACALELAAVLKGSAVGRHGAQIHRPDLDGWEHEVWVDCMHLDGPFLAHLAVATGDVRWSDLATKLLLRHARVLQDERSGLFSHGFDDASGERNRIHWGRGQGWALLGLVDTLRHLPPGHRARAEATNRLHALVEGLAATETSAGEWHTVVDSPGTYVETSVSAFVALGVGRGMRYGHLPTSWGALVERALTATVRNISPGGFLEGVSDATPVGADAAHYGARNRGSFPWGQGPALLALIEQQNGPATVPEVSHG